MCGGHDMIRMYLESMIIYILIGSPIYLLSRYLYVKYKTQQIAWMKETLLFLFVMFCIGVASQTIIPHWYLIVEDGKQQLSIQWSEGLRSINLIPFATIISYFALENDQVSNWNEVSRVNLLGNIVIFVPFGIFLPLLWKAFRKFSSLFWIAIGIPLLIEILQLFIGRSTDIDDVILNALGIMFGFSLYKIFQNFFHKGKDSGVRKNSK